MSVKKLNSTLSLNSENKKPFHKTTISKIKIGNYLNYQKIRLMDERNYFIQKDNERLVSKIKQIAFRPNKLLEPNIGILKYRKKKEKNLKSVRKLYKKSLDESNSFFKNKLSQSKSYINNKKIFEDYKMTRKAYNNLRKIFPLNNIDNSLKNSVLQYKSLDEVMDKPFKIKTNKNYSYLPLIKIYPL